MWHVAQEIFPFTLGGQSKTYNREKRYFRGQIGELILLLSRKGNAGVLSASLHTSEAQARWGP